MTENNEAICPFSGLQLDFHLRLDENVHGGRPVCRISDADHRHPGWRGAARAPARAVSGTRVYHPVQVINAVLLLVNDLLNKRL